MALSVVGPAAAADGLDVSVSQEGDDVTVSVTENGTENRTAVADANVTVADGNTTYEEAGNYTTDDEGLVELSAPDENVTVTVTATVDNDSASTTTDLIAESIAENETDGHDVNETEDDGPENETEDDGPENETEDDGPENETEVGDRLFDIELDISIDNGTVNYSNVTVNDSDPFGPYVGTFVHTIANENVSGPMGQTVSSFVTTFNPGQGPPEHAGPPENKTQGPPEHAGPPENKTQGPPEGVGPSENTTQGPSGNVTQGPPEDVGPSNDDETEDDDRQRGPPSHARGGR